MKILIALASSSGQISGVQRHAINLAHSLLTRREITEVHLVAAPWQLGFIQDAFSSGEKRLYLHAAPIGTSALSRNFWFYSQLPKLATYLEADIVHLAYPIPMRSGAFQCPTVVTLHDLYPYDIPENFGFPKVLFNRAVLQQCLREADVIACVSESTLSRLKHLAPRFVEKATVVYNSVVPPVRGTAEFPLPERAGLPFLLCVAQHRRNKNILLALRVFERLLRVRQLHAETRLFIVGITGPETQAIRDFVAAKGLAHAVVLLNGISDAQLQWCYFNCSLVLAPSALEGFGLPVAEALLAGCRIVCSDIPAFRELGRSHCRFVPLGSNAVEEFADAVRVTLLEQIPKPILLPQLSPAVIAERYMRLYRSLLTARVTSAGAIEAQMPSTREGQNLL